jgi:hypothetical protein
MDSNLNLLKAKQNRQPFRSSRIEFASGHQIPIDADTELLFPRSRLGLVIEFTAGGLMHQFESAVIARLIEAS